jgi:hypothetical protein
MSAMGQDDSVPVSVVAFRAEALSPDGNSVLISLRTKFSVAERKYSVPLECFRDLIVDLQRLSASMESRSAEPSRRLLEETPKAAE